MVEALEIDTQTIQKLFGVLDCNLNFIEKEFKVRLSARDGRLEVSGAEPAVVIVIQLIKSLVALIGRGIEIDKQKIKQCADVLFLKPEEIENINTDIVAVTSKGKQITCKTLGQRDYVKAIKSNTVVFGIGPAGSGKTYLAVALAYAAFKKEQVEKIILTRPALEAGEKLGFLPGDLQTKIDPYLRPLYDALSEMFGLDNYIKLIEKGSIEIAPLAYMRGRTLANAYIILDEAQNTTQEQMKMFLTRLGPNSRMIITGDDTQIDLPFGKSSGLIQAVNILKNIEGIEIIKLSDKDIVRSELVQRIVLAYNKAEENKQKIKNSNQNNDT